MAAAGAVILVTGCPRSGTSSIATWLLTAPGVGGGLETRRTIAAHAWLTQVSRFSSLTLERDAARAAIRRAVLELYPAGARPLDKEPLEPVALPEGDYAAYLANMREALGARLLYMVRDPVRVVASMRRRRWGYSLNRGRPVQLTPDECVSIWRKTARLAVAESLRAPDVVRVQPLEDVNDEAAGVDDGPAICSFLGVSPPAPAPPRVPYAPTLGPELAGVLAATAPERELLVRYDDRPRGAGRVLLLTGEPGSGKSMLAELVGTALQQRGARFVVLDGDRLRRELWPELGYEPEARLEAAARAGRLACRLARGGAIVIVAMVVPATGARVLMRQLAHPFPFHLVRVIASPERRALRRPPEVFEGLNYEEPVAPDVVVDDVLPRLEAVQRVLALLG